MSFGRGGSGGGGGFRVCPGFALSGGVFSGGVFSGGIRRCLVCGEGLFCLRGDFGLSFRQLIEEGLAESLLLVFFFRGGGLARFAERFLLRGESLRFVGEGFGLAALFFEHFGEGGSVVLQHFAELLLDAVLLVAKLLGLAPLLLGKLFLSLFVRGAAGHLGGLLFGALGPVLGLHREFLLTIGEFVEFGNGFVVFLRRAHRLGEFVELADGLLNLLAGLFGVRDTCLLLVGHGDHVGLFLCLGETLVSDFFGLPRLLLEKRGIERGRDLLELVAGGLVVFGEFVQLFLRLIVDLL